MNSFALWFESTQEGSHKFEAEVHFNLWNLHYRRALPPCLDVGIKILDISGCGTLNFYLPFPLESEAVHDLGKTLRSSEILCSVFNEDYILSRQANEKVLNITDTSGNKVMTIYCLDEKNDIFVKKRFEGTILSITIPDVLRDANGAVYFRFRVQSKAFYRIIKKYSPKNVTLQSAVSVIEAIDFRFNDYRSLNSSLLEHIRKGESCNIRKVHFLLLTEADVEISFSSDIALARELENNIWNGYFEWIGNKNIVAYHWTFKQKDITKLIPNCIMFIKTKVHKCNWITILVYLASLSVITLLINFLGLKLFG